MAKSLKKFGKENGEHAARKIHLEALREAESEQELENFETDDEPVLEEHDGSEDTSD